MIDELPFLHVVSSEIKKQTELFFAEHPHLTRGLTIDTYYDYTSICQSRRGRRGRNGGAPAAEWFI
ncbi:MULTISPECIES: hypothetical protein [unclassified Mycobacterium]|uniref:hypothetical protein n=1 Tax=unclassified Mycobacterium TaxID=2642494 RepID=UPI0029C757B5|nr:MULTISPECIES: hypothetical protein [unclassified Mycobacterium]